MYYSISRLRKQKQKFVLPIWTEWNETFSRKSFEQLPRGLSKTKRYLIVKTLETVLNQVAVGRLKVLAIFCETRFELQDCARELNTGYGCGLTLSAWTAWILWWVAVSVIPPKKTELMTISLNYAQNEQFSRFLLDVNFSLCTIILHSFSYSYRFAWKSCSFKNMLQRAARWRTC